MSKDQITRELLIEGIDDWIPVDRIILLSRRLGESENENFQRVFISTIESLLRKELMAVGDLGETGFEPWKGDVDDLVTKVVHQVEQAEWSPLGGACWFANTELGDRLASIWDNG